MSEQDLRFCYGATCTWFGGIAQVGSFGRRSLPVCPCCAGILFELPYEQEWWDSVDGFEKAGHEGYRAMLEWQRERKRCFRAPSSLVLAYKLATGKTVKL